MLGKITADHNPGRPDDREIATDVYTDDPTQYLTDGQLIGIAQHGTEIQSNEGLTKAGTVYTYWQDGIASIGIVYRRRTPEEEEEGLLRMRREGQDLCPECGR